MRHGESTSGKKWNNSYVGVSSETLHVSRCSLPLVQKDTHIFNSPVGHKPIGLFLCPQPIDFFSGYSKESTDSKTKKKNPEVTRFPLRDIQGTTAYLKASVLLKRYLTPGKAILFFLSRLRVIGSFNLLVGVMPDKGKSVSL